MLEILGLILLAVGATGFGLGAYWDLKYTEFPDWLPYGIIFLSIAARGLFSLYMWDFSYLISSVIVGCLFLGFGLLLFYLKQWGDGDAWLLGAMGFLFPDSAGFSSFSPGIMPFPVSVLLNFFLIALFYLIFYSIALGLRYRRHGTKFLKEIRKNSKKIAAYFSAFLVISFTVSFYMSWNFSIPIQNFASILFLPFLALFMMVFIFYARAVEGSLFLKKVPVKNLRPGDVLVNEKWRGLTEAEIRKLIKKGGYVWIKEGVRFAPVFIINLLVTLFYGSLLAVFLVVF